VYAEITALWRTVSRRAGGTASKKETAAGRRPAAACAATSEVAATGHGFERKRSAAAGRSWDRV